MNHKKNTALLLSLLAITALFISCSESSDSTKDVQNSNCPTKTCGDFKNQADAQKTFESNKKCYKNLDADGNGKACEHLK
jgi:hypothetical protein